MAGIFDLCILSSGFCLGFAVSGAKHKFLIRFLTRELQKHRRPNILTRVAQLNTLDCEYAR